MIVDQRSMAAQPLAAIVPREAVFSAGINARGDVVGFYSAGLNSIVGFFLTK